MFELELICTINSCYKLTRTFDTLMRRYYPHIILLQLLSACCLILILRLTELAHAAP